MKRKPEDVFSPEKNTAARRDFIDYDYLDKLSEEEQAWLAQATDEFYGAAFDINATYSLRADAIKICQNEIDKLIEKANDTESFLKNPSNPYLKWVHNLNRFKSSRTKYVQIYGNPAKKDNLDLRKCRSIDLFYKNASGKFTQNKDYKYDSIHDFEEFGADCNRRSKESAKDLFSVQNRTSQDANEFYLDTEAAGTYTPEEYMILEEVEEMLDDMEDQVIIRFKVSVYPEHSAE